MAGGISRKWTLAETQELVHLCDEGVTKSEAARRLDRSVSSIVSRGRMLGLSFLREDSWTDDDIHTLESMAKAGKTAYDIAEVLGRSSRAVECKAREWKVVLADLNSKPCRQHDQWTCADISYLESALDRGSSAEEIAVTLERTPKAIYSKMAVLGLHLLKV